VSRIVFLGTPPAAVTVLRRIADRVALVVTRPDRPQGRSGKPVPPAVKEFAAVAGIPVIQPGRSSDLAGMLREHAPLDLGVVVAFGMLLRPDALSVPRHGHLNVHFSVLPRWRGAAPVQAAILSGDERTGVSLMHLDEGLDTGPVVAVRSTAIAPDEDAGALTDRLAIMGAELLGQELEPFLAGRRWPSPQPPDGVTFAGKVGATDRALDLSRPALELERRIRALAPEPGARVDAGGQPLQILAARAMPGTAPVGAVSVEGGQVRLGTGSGLLQLTTVKPAGRRSMPAGEWMRGARISLLR
jgi:methionyl-tRNA formyltransferase